MKTGVTTTQQQTFRRAWRIQMHWTGNCHYVNAAQTFRCRPILDILGSLTLSGLSAALSWGRAVFSLRPAGDVVRLWRCTEGKQTRSRNSYKSEC